MVVCGYIKNRPVVHELVGDHSVQSQVSVVGKNSAKLGARR